MEIIVSCICSTIVSFFTSAVVGILIGTKYFPMVAERWKENIEIMQKACIQTFDEHYEKTGG